MKKDVADYLSTRREIEAIMYDEGNRFMYDLSHLPEVLQRWTEYKETKKKSALKMADLEEILNAKEGGKTTIEVFEEPEKDSKNKEATPEEVLDVALRTKTLLQLTNAPVTYVRELGQEVSNLKKVAFTAIAAGLFDILFLN